MSIEINVIYKCDICEVEHEDDDKYICHDCNEKQIQENIKDSIRDVYSKDYLWKDKEHFIGFKTEEERDIYCMGVRKGIRDALFWIAEYHGEIKFFEQLQDEYKS